MQGVSGRVKSVPEIWFRLLTTERVSAEHDLLSAQADWRFFLCHHEGMKWKSRRN
jgi:hypothetical protein